MLVLVVLGMILFTFSSSSFPFIKIFMQIITWPFFISHGEVVFLAGN